MRNCCSLFLPPFPFPLPTNASPKYHSLSLVETMQTTHWPIQCHLTPCHSTLTSSIPFLSQSSTAAGQALRAAWEPFNDFGQLDDTAHSETSNKDIYTHPHTHAERDDGITTTNSSGWSTAWPLMDASDRSIADAMAINCCVSRAPPDAASTRVEIGQKFNIFACVQSEREQKGSRREAKEGHPPQPEARPDPLPPLRWPFWRIFR